MQPNTWKRAASTAVILVATMTLAGCGDDSSSGSMPGMEHGTKPAAPSSAATASGEFNDADVTFASHMIPHHQQALQMASMAGYMATTSEVKQLAAAINAAQEPEIKVMSGWLTKWGKPIPSAQHGGHGADEMPGIMTEDEMSELGKQKGSMFDRMWIEMMIKHHQGAVSMAKTEQTTGKDPAAIALAKKVETDQTREIAAMKRLLGQLPVS
ncbi:DUF305 domain-containing protein [Kribbella sp. NPDC049174]|uniref:DUF305 domain-containing protein n=1 Tax=Kribbella sp. NPDC049174 TaxID=3364112 RepID=UPI0037193F92